MAVFFHSLFRVDSFNVCGSICGFENSIIIYPSANRVIDYFSMTSTGLVPTPLRRWVSCQVIIGGALILSVETQLMMRGAKYISP